MPALSFKPSELVISRLLFPDSGQKYVAMTGSIAQFAFEFHYGHQVAAVRRNVDCRFVSMRIIIFRK